MLVFLLHVAADAHPAQQVRAKEPLMRHQNAIWLHVAAWLQNIVQMCSKHRCLFEIPSRIGRILEPTSTNNYQQVFISQKLGMSSSSCMVLPIIASQWIMLHHYINLQYIHIASVCTNARLYMGIHIHKHVNLVSVLNTQKYLNQLNASAHTYTANVYISKCKTLTGPSKCLSLHVRVDVESARACNKWNDHKPVSAHANELHQCHIAAVGPCRACRSATSCCQWPSPCRSAQPSPLHQEEPWLIYW